MTNDAGHTTADTPEPVDAIVVGAHPDDVEIGCGGTIALLVRQGFRVGIIDLTDGEPTPGSPGPEVRLAEAQAAATALGVTFRKVLPLPNRRLFDGWEARVALAKEFRKYKPRLVIGLGDKTPLASPDHAQAVAITDAAIFYSRLTKWDAHFDHLPVHTITHQLYFTLGFRHFGPAMPGYPLFMDIGDTMDAKFASIRCYATQFPPNKQHLFERLKAANVHQGMMCGCAAAEVLYAPHPLPMKGLFADLLRREPS